MKLYYAPGSCSLGIHVLLEELGRPFELERVDLRAGAQNEPGYRAVSAKAKVPALRRDDGSVLTEYGAISHFLAAGTPLAPNGVEEMVRTIEATDYVVATIHMQGFARVFRPSRFSPNEAEHPAVQLQGRTIVQAGFDLLAGRMEDRAHPIGRFGIVDMALFYVEQWALHRASIEMPPALAVHHAHMMTRPAVMRALATEAAV